MFHSYFLQFSSLLEQISFFSNKKTDLGLLLFEIKSVDYQIIIKTVIFSTKNYDFLQIDRY